MYEIFQGPINNGRIVRQDGERTEIDDGVGILVIDSAVGICGSERAGK